MVGVACIFRGLGDWFGIPYAFGKFDFLLAPAFPFGGMENPLMTFATPGALGDRNYFHRNFDRRKDSKASERLAARLRPFLLRRTKAQVARDLPSRTEETLISEMSGRQAELYKEELARAQMLVLSSSGFDMVNKRRFALLQALTRLRQICCHPQLVGSDTASGKTETLFELLEPLMEKVRTVRSSKR